MLEKCTQHSTVAQLASASGCYYNNGSNYQEAGGSSPPGGAGYFLFLESRYKYFR